MILGQTLHWLGGGVRPPRVLTCCLTGGAPVGPNLDFTLHLDWGNDNCLSRGGGSCLAPRPCTREDAHESRTLGLHRTSSAADRLCHSDPAALADPRGGLHCLDTSRWFPQLRSPVFRLLSTLAPGVSQLAPCVSRLLGVSPASVSNPSGESRNRFFCTRGACQDAWSWIRA